jgi:hypothetical protein
MLRVLIALLVLAVCTLISWNAAAEADDWIAAVIFIAGLVLLAFVGHRIGELWIVALPFGPLLILASVGIADDNPPGSWGELWLLNLVFASALAAGALGVGHALGRRRAPRP